MNGNFGKIRAALENVETDAVRDACALFLSEGVEKRADVYAVSSRWSDFDRVGTFAELVQTLKRVFQFQELRSLSIEGGSVYVEAGGRKVELPAEYRGAEETRSMPPLAVPKHRGANDGSGRFGNLEL